MTLFVVCFYRARINAERYGYRQRRARGWAIWGWIVPIVNLWFPFQIMGDIWRAGLPAVQKFLSRNRPAAHPGRPEDPTLYVRIVAYTRVQPGQQEASGEAVTVRATAIRTEGLTKRYGGVAALDHLDLEVAQGEVVGYLGPNGAGKTTTIRLLLGLINPTQGRGEIFGLDCHRQPVETHRRLAFVPGEADLWPSLTGAETLELLGRVQGQVDKAYRDELVARFELDPAKKVRAYSKGNRQKVVLIAALMTRADLLVLDEPTSGLDPLMEQAFRRSIREARDRGQTVFLSSHILSEVEALCDRVGILRAGKLVEMGTLAEMRHLAALTVEATFDGVVPDLSGVPGVTSVEVNGRVVRCHVRGPVAPLLKVLANAGVTELLSREPSLEELFLAQYGGDAQGEATQGDPPSQDAQSEAAQSQGAHHGAR